jgi:hypothetical protein
MNESPFLPNYNGIRYPEGMSPFKAGSLLMKVATVGSSDGKIKKGKGGAGKKGKASGKSVSKSMARTITSIKK